MTRPFDPLPILTVKSPCSVPWDTMRGDDRVRHCEKCDLAVYNFAALSTPEITELLRQNSGRRVCGALYRRADGTLVTRDCESENRPKVRFVSHVASAALSAAMSISLAAAQSTPPSNSATESPRSLTGLSVTMEDPVGARIPKVKVSVIDAIGAEIARGETDEAGKLLLAGLPVGHYRVRFTPLPGFHISELQVEIKRDRITELVERAELGEAIMGDVVLVDTALDSPPTPPSEIKLPFVLPFDAGQKDSPQPPAKSHQRVTGMSITITDTIGERMPGIKASVLDLAGSEIAKGETDSDGQVVLAGLQPGHYRVHFEVPHGFAMEDMLVRVKKGKVTEFEKETHLPFMGVVDVVKPREIKPK